MIFNIITIGILIYFISKGLTIKLERENNLLKEKVDELTKAQKAQNALYERKITMLLKQTRKF